MTNTRYIGNPHDKDKSGDTLTARNGYKVAALWLNGDDEIRVVSPHFNSVQFPMSADSKCEALKHHAQFGSCTCGFYAYNNVDAAVRHRRIEANYDNFAVMQVALSGDIIIAEHGYRASHQRVKRILMPRCWNCSEAGEGMVLHETRFFVAACRQCVKKKVEFHTFEDFSKRISVEKFAPIQITSAKKISKEAEAFLAPESIRDTAFEAISKLSSLGRFDLIEEVAQRSAMTVIENDLKDN